jgi:hypothetical protein
MGWIDGVGCIVERVLFFTDWTIKCQRMLSVSEYARMPSLSAAWCRRRADRRLRSAAAGICTAFAVSFFAPAPADIGAASVFAAAAASLSVPLCRVV